MKAKLIQWFPNFANVTTTNFAEKLVLAVIVFLLIIGIVNL